MNAGAYPDLRRTPALRGPGFADIVIGGGLAGQGMPSFAGMLSAADAEAIRAYLVRRANEDRASEWERSSG